MKVTKNKIEFESQRESEIFLMLLREVCIGDLRPELYKEGVEMLDSLMEMEK